MWWRVEVLIDALEMEYPRKGHNLYLREQIDSVGRTLYPCSSIPSSSGDSTWAISGLFMTTVVLASAVGRFSAVWRRSISVASDLALPFPL